MSLSINGRRIGQADNVISMTVAGDSLYALTSEHKLWSRSRFEEDTLKPWTLVGDIDPTGRAIVASFDWAENNGWAFIATTDDRLKSVRFPNIVFADRGPADGAVAMTADVENVYAATNDNKLKRYYNPRSKPVSWYVFGDANQVVAMGAIGGNRIYDAPRFNDGWLLLATNDGNTGRIWIRDSLTSEMNWVPVTDFGVKITAMTAVSVNYWSGPGLSPSLVPLAGRDLQVIGLLYTVTANNELWFGEVLRPIPWTILQRGRIRTSEEADVIDYAIEADAVSRDKVEFVLTLGPNVTWRKSLWLPDGEGTTSVISVQGAETGTKSLLARQVQNGQALTFWKAKKDRDVDVRKLGELDGLSPGSRVTFRWIRD